MAQNIYDNPDFFDGYSQLPRSRLGLDGAPEWPALRAQLPTLKGLRVLDLGCGYGWFCRWAHAQGAASVLGLDLSTLMLDRARELTSVAGIAYEQADLEQLDLSRHTFDLVYSSLAFHYVQDLPQLLRVIRAALAPGGRLVFSIEHPIYMAAMQPGWLSTQDGRRIWAMDSYQIEGKRETDWLAKGVVKYHRTIGTLINALIAARFSVQHVEDWGPTEADLARQPALAEEVQRPMMLLIQASAFSPAPPPTHPSPG